MLGNAPVTTLDTQKPNVTTPNTQKNASMADTIAGYVNNVKEVVENDNVQNAALTAATVVGGAVQTPEASAYVLDSMKGAFASAPKLLSDIALFPAKLMKLYEYYQAYKKGDMNLEKLLGVAQTLKEAATTVQSAYTGWVGFGRFRKAREYLDGIEPTTEADAKIEEFDFDEIDAEIEQEKRDMAILNAFALSLADVKVETAEDIEEKVINRKNHTL